MKKKKLWTMVTAGFLGCYLCLMGILTFYTREEVVFQEETQWFGMWRLFQDAVSRAEEKGKDTDTEGIRRWRLNTLLNTLEYEDSYDNLFYDQNQRSQFLAFSVGGSVYAGGTELFALGDPDCGSLVIDGESGSPSWGPMSLLDWADPVVVTNLDASFWEGILPFVEKNREFVFQGKSDTRYEYVGTYEQYRYEETTFVVLREMDVVERHWVIQDNGQRVPDETKEDRKVFRWVNGEEYEGELLRTLTDEENLLGEGLRIYFAPYLASNYTPNTASRESYEAWKTDEFLQGTEFQKSLQENHRNGNILDYEHFPESPWDSQGEQKSGFFKVKMWYSFPVTYCGELLICRMATIGYPVQEAMGRLQPVYLYGLIVTIFSVLLVGSILVRLEKRKARLEQNRRDLTNAMAHEMKTPLAVIRNFSENIREETSEEKRLHYLDVVIQKTEEMDEIVKRLVTVSELDGEKTVGIREELDLSRLLLEEMEKLHFLIEEKDLHISVKSQPVIQKGNEKMMSQIFYNLLSNAVSYTPPGGTVDVTLNQTSFSVENTGRRIAEEEKDKIWEPFYHGASKKEGHMGLGLYLVRQITRQYGMTCRYENTRDGVRFTVEFQQIHFCPVKQKTAE